jgi:adenylyltransferase/sulfurtransferase
MKPESSPASRHDRQRAFAPLGEAGQQRLGDSRVLIVGAGGLGSHLAELLARAGVGFIRLVDDDRIDWSNLARQTLYTADDAAQGRLKVNAAAEAIAKIDPGILMDAQSIRVSAENLPALAGDCDLLLDGTDDMPTRYLLNDFAVAAAKPWVYAGVVGAEGMVMPVVPGRACLRCLLEDVPTNWPRAIAAMEALKILAGCDEAVSRHLLRLELWGNVVQRLDASHPRPDCPACRGGGGQASHPVQPPIVT